MWVCLFVCHSLYPHDMNLQVSQKGVDGCAVKATPCSGFHTSRRRERVYVIL